MTRKDANLVETIGELNCPYCGNVMTNQEYNQAAQEFKRKVEQEYREQFDQYKKGFEDQLQEQEKKYRSEIEYMNNTHSGQIKLIRQELKSAQDGHLEELRKEYNERSIQKEKDFNEKIQQLLTVHQKEIKEKEKLIHGIQKDQQQFKEQAIQEARAAIKNEMLQKEEQIRRFKEKAEALEKQLTVTQSELKGEAGETDLLNRLKEAFRQEGDIFTRQTRGVSEGDIVQQIRTSSGAILETTIVYDNKEVAAVTKRDIDKGKYYREHHKTPYFFIVSGRLPKSIRNRYIVKKDGITIVHRDVIVDIAKFLRGAIIEIEKSSASKRSQETKETKLYNLIVGTEFSKWIESLCENHTRLVELDTKDKKAHEIVWNKRSDLLDQLINSYIDISSQIDAIIQEPQREPPQDPPVEEDSNDTDNETPLEEYEDEN